MIQQNKTSARLQLGLSIFGMCWMASLFALSTSEAIARASSSGRVIGSDAVEKVVLRREEAACRFEAKTSERGPQAGRRLGADEREFAGNDYFGQGNDVRQLKTGEVIERALSGGEVHHYEIKLDQGQFLQVRADQQGIDIVLTLIGPDNKQIVEIDSPNDRLGPEAVSFVTEVAGSYQVEVGSLNKGAVPGRYEIRIEALRAAVPQDRDRVAAQSLFAEGRGLIEGTTADSLRKAIQKFEAALPLLRAVNDRQREVHTLSSMSRSYSLLGEHQNAMAYKLQLLEIVRAIGDRIGEADTLNNIGTGYYSLGENQKALDYYHQSLEVGQTLGNSASPAPTLTNIGLVYSVLGDAHRAIDNYKQALPLVRNSGDRSSQSIVLNRIGQAYSTLGDNQTALDYYQQSLTLAKASDDRQSEGFTIISIGSLYESEGEYEQALNYYKQSLELNRSIGYRRGEANSLNNIGGIYNSLDEAAKALDYLNQAVPVWQALNEKRGAARTLSNIGRSHDTLGDKQEALNYFNRSLSLMRDVGDRRGEAQTLSYIGTIFDSQGDKQKALEYFTQALRITRDTEDRRGEARTLNYLGATVASQGDSQKALNYYRQGLLLSQAVKDRQLEAAGLQGMARCERDLGRLAKARELIERALSLIEVSRSRIASTELRTSYFASVRQYHEFAVDLLMRLHQSRPAQGYDAIALEANERANARSLQELLIESRVNIRHAADPALLDRERSIRERLNAKAERQTQLLNRKHSDEQAAAFRKEIEDFVTQYDDIKAKIRISSPRYAALTQPLKQDVKEIQRRLLDPDTLLLEYSLGDERSYLWAVTRTSLESFALPKRAEIDRAARLVYELLTARNRLVKFETAKERQARIAKADVDYMSAARLLSEMLLSPVAGRLGRNRLLIVSDGALHYIPFAALPAPSSPQADNKEQIQLGNFQPLIAEHEVINLPSALSLAILRKDLSVRRPAPKTLAILADPVFDKDDERVKNYRADKTPDKTAGALPRGGSSNRSLEADLLLTFKETTLGDEEIRIRRLPFTRREATQIAALVPRSQRKEALDFAASRATATSGELSQYRWVHFATHGFLNNRHPQLSGIVLSLVDQDGADQDGFLRSYEVFNLKLPAEMVVLSGCRTGLGKEVKGEGLIGLTRGFMYAGASRVLVSLWDIADEPSAELMVQLYREMLGKERLRPSAALRAAQIKVWKQKRWEAPYYWAGFILQGEPR